MCGDCELPKCIYPRDMDTDVLSDLVKDCPHHEPSVLKLAKVTSSTKVLLTLVVSVAICYCVHRICVCRERNTWEAVELERAKSTYNKGVYDCFRQANNLGASNEGN